MCTWLTAAFSNPVAPKVSKDICPGAVRQSTILMQLVGLSAHRQHRQQALLRLSPCQSCLYGCAWVPGQPHRCRCFCWCVSCQQQAACQRDLHMCNIQWVTMRANPETSDNDIGWQL